VNVKKIVGFLAIVFLIFFVVTRPNSAANSVESIGNFLTDAGSSLSTFFEEIIN